MLQLNRDSRSLSLPAWLYLNPGHHRLMPRHIQEPLLWYPHLVQAPPVNFSQCWQSEPEITDQLVSLPWLIPCNSFPQYLGSGPIHELTSTVLSIHSPKLESLCTWGSRQVELLFSPRVQLPGHDAMLFPLPETLFPCLFIRLNWRSLGGQKRKPTGVRVVKERGNQKKEEKREKLTQKHVSLCCELGVWGLEACPILGLHFL